MASGAFATSVPLLLAMVGWICGAGLVTFEAVRTLVGYGDAAAWLALDALYILQTAWWLTRLGTYPLFIPVLFQVPLAFFGVVSLGSFYRTAVLKSVRWKGRTIAVAPRPRGPG
jgi:4,4'-diaponeurosporenoate glycosyltransferase